MSQYRKVRDQHLAIVAVGAAAAALAVGLNRGGPILAAGVAPAAADWSELCWSVTQLVDRKPSRLCQNAAELGTWDIAAIQLQTIRSGLTQWARDLLCAGFLPVKLSCAPREPVHVAVMAPRPHLAAVVGPSSKPHRAWSVRGIWPPGRSHLSCAVPWVPSPASS